MVGFGNNNSKYGAGGQDDPGPTFQMLGAWWKLISSTMNDYYFAVNKMVKRLLCLHPGNVRGDTISSCFPPPPFVGRKLLQNFRPTGLVLAAAAAAAVLVIVRCYYSAT